MGSTSCAVYSSAILKSLSPSATSVLEELKVTSQSHMYGGKLTTGCLWVRYANSIH